MDALISARLDASSATRDRTAKKALSQSVDELAADFAARARGADEADAFVADNAARLKASPLLAAGVPRELGGGDATLRELCMMLSQLAQCCSSTALAFAMHTHQIAVAAWRWRHQKAPSALLERVVREHLWIASSGGSDWLSGSGQALRVDGGFRIQAHKVFVSAAPAADLLMTCAVCDDSDAGPTVLHFGLPMRAAEVSIVENWRTLGMRGTGSHEVQVSGYFLPDAAVTGRRPAGRWHPLFQIISMIAFPLIYAVYAGVAQSARDRAVALAARRRGDNHLLRTVGRLENESAAAQWALEAMIAAGESDEPGFATTHRVFSAKAQLVTHLLRIADLSLEVAGGAGFHRDAGLEQLFRDLQAARYHPLSEGDQLLLAGRMAMGLTPERDLESVPRA